MAELDAESDCLGTNDQTRSKGSEGGRTAAVDHGGLDYLRATVKEIVRAAKLRDDLSFCFVRRIYRGSGR